MAICNWNPWMGGGLAGELERLVDRFFGQNAGAETEAGCLWTPAADVSLTERVMIVQMELAGLTLEDVRLEARNDSLWVYGQRRFERDAEGADYQALERAYGPFARRFELPEDADRQGITATLRNGLLEITIPRASRRSAIRRIPVDGD